MKTVPNVKISGKISDYLKEIIHIRKMLSLIFTVPTVVHTVFRNCSNFVKLTMVLPK